MKRDGALHLVISIIPRLNFSPKIMAENEMISSEGVELSITHKTPLKNILKMAGYLSS